MTAGITEIAYLSGDPIQLVRVRPPETGGSRFSQACIPGARNSREGLACCYSMGIRRPSNAKPSRAEPRAGVRLYSAR